jgi:penicillin-binding protein 2
VSDRSSLRLMVLGALLFSLILTMFGRLFYLQVIASKDYTQIGANNSAREVITPAPRGLILDQAGRPLVSNRTSLVVSLDRAALEDQPDHGQAVLTRLAVPLGTTFESLFERLQLCGTKFAVPGVCWNGSPFQPIPVAKDVSTDLALSIMERRADFPGVMAQLESVRQYPEPDRANAAHLLGYLGAVSQDELAKQQQELDDGTLSPEQATLTGTDLVGRSGLEAEYDRELRGQPGVKTLAVNISANVTGVVSETDPTPGNYLVTNIDADLQSVVEQQLLAAVDRARSLKDPTTQRPYRADSAAAVVVDVTNGHVLAMASYPTYDPKVWVGGISKKDYRKLTRKRANTPLLSRATQGLFAPASTFKIATTSAALQDGYSQTQPYDCPSSMKIGPQTFRNYESEYHGPITLKRAIEVSCDTVYYNIAYDMWKAAGGISAKKDAPDPIATMAKAYGLGSATGIDLPGESAGHVGGRAYKQAYWAQLGPAICERARTGYPEVAKDDPGRARTLQEYARDNCRLQGAYLPGDAANLAIGQGDTDVTPLQMTMAYAALANGGTLYHPQVAKALMAPDGSVVKRFKKQKAGRLPVSASNLAYLQDAFRATTTNGTGAGPFEGFPLKKVGGVASKTGTGQAANGKQSTSWFATYAPADKPKYAVVMMVSQGGTGSGTSGPSVRKIYESLFGVTGSKVDPSKSVLVGGTPQRALPTIGSDGLPNYPGEAKAEKKAAKKAARQGQSGDAAAPDRAPAAGGLLALPFTGGLLLVRRRRSRRPPPAAVVVASGAPPARVRLLRPPGSGP